MNPKRERLRKRYVNPSPSPDASGVYTLGPRSMAAEPTDGQPTTMDTNVTLDAGTELEAQIHELSRVLGAVVQTKTAKYKKEPVLT